MSDRETHMAANEARRVLRKLLIWSAIILAMAAVLFHLFGPESGPLAMLKYALLFVAVLDYLVGITVFRERQEHNSKRE